MTHLCGLQPEMSQLVSLPSLMLLAQAYRFRWPLLIQLATCMHLV